MLGNFFTQMLGRETLIAADDTWALLMFMCVGAAISIVLEQKYKWASKISGPVIALILALFCSNFNILPTSSVLYDTVVWSYVVPMAVCLLLLQCNLHRVWKDTGKMLGVFLIGAVGTFAGAAIGYVCLKGQFADTEAFAAIASVTVGSYVGGGVNSAALLGQFPVGKSLNGARVVADNFLMTLYFFALIAFAGMKFFRSRFSHPHIEEVEKSGSQEDSSTQAAAFWKRKEISLKDIALCIAYSALCVWVSRIIGGIFSGMVPENPNIVMDFVGKFFGSQYVWITAITTVVATLCHKQVEQVSGAQEIGTYMIYLFFFVMGIPANLIVVLRTTPWLFVFMAIVVAVNMIFCFIGGKVIKADLEDCILASNANIGGPTTAAGMAIAQGWSRMVAPSMLVGVLGYAIGTYLGMILGIILGVS